MPSQLVNVLITNKNIPKHVTKTPSYSPFQKRTFALGQQSRLVNVVNLNLPNGENGCIAQKTAEKVLHQEQEHANNLEMLHVLLLEAVINPPLVFTNQNLARFKNV